MKELSYLPLNYKGVIKFFDTKTDYLKKNNEKFSNFINNYFIKNKRKYFISKDFDYYNIPQDIRSNSYIETYNKFISCNQKSPPNYPGIIFTQLSHPQGKIGKKL